MYGRSIMAYDINKYIDVFLKKGLDNSEIQEEKLKHFNGYLYKYCPLPNQFSLSNLENSIIHYSKPDTFNDPFDCFCGYNYKEYVEEILIALIFDPALNLTSDLYDCYYKLILHRQLTEEEFILFNQHLYLKNELRSDKINLSDLLSNVFDIRVSNLLKLLTEDSNEKLISEFFSVCRNNTFNKTLFKAINDTYGITCFCESFDNALLWSHYANKHRGICIEYNFNLLPKNYILLPTLFPVIYSKDRQVIPTGISYDENNKLQVNTPQLTTYQIIKNLISKSDIWSYEREWRSINWLSVLDDNQNIALPIISKVYLGVNISDKDRETVFEICKRNNITAVQLKISNSKYELQPE